MWTYARVWWNGEHEIKLTITAPRFDAETYRKISEVILELQQRVVDE